MGKFPKSQSFSRIAIKRSNDDRRVRPRFPFIDVFRRSLFVPRTQTFNRNRVQLTIGCPIGPNSSASTERLMRWIECAFEREKSPEMNASPLRDSNPQLVTRQVRIAY